MYVATISFWYEDSVKVVLGTQPHDEFCASAVAIREGVRARIAERNFILKEVGDDLMVRIVFGT